MTFTSNKQKLLLLVWLLPALLLGGAASAQGEPPKCIDVCDQCSSMCGHVCGAAKANSFGGAAASPMLFGLDPSAPIPKSYMITPAEYCVTVYEEKPVMSLELITQSRMVHLLVVLSDLPPPYEEADTIGDLYKQEVYILMSAGFPDSVFSKDPGCVVTGYQWALIRFHLAMVIDEDFAKKHGGVTDNCDKIAPVVEAGLINVESDYLCEYLDRRLYECYYLAALCAEEVTLKQIEEKLVHEGLARRRPDIYPIELIDATIEEPGSPI